MTVLVVFVASWLAVSQGFVGAQDPSPDTSTTSTTVEDSTTNADESTTTTAIDSTTTTDVAESTTTTVTEGPAAPPDVTPASVPTPGPGEAVITVKVGGERTGDGDGDVSGLAGVTLQLFDGDAEPTVPAVGVDPNTCESDADGDCSWVIPETQDGGANSGRRFWIQQIGAAPDTFINPELTTIDTAGAREESPYRFQTPALVDGQIYTSTSHFMFGTSTSLRTASSGIWQSSTVNPRPAAMCGTSVALVIDLSSSVGQNLGNLKEAATSFVNSLVGTPSTVALFTFASVGPAVGDNNINRPVPMPVSTQTGANVVNGFIAGLSLPTFQFDGRTNWDRGLAQVAEAVPNYDAAVVITDGNPTRYNDPQEPATTLDTPTRFRELENGIFSANAIKAQGTRVIGFGVGTAIAGSPVNLQAISGPVENSDFFRTDDYELAGDALRQFALGQCTGTVSVVKQVVPSDAPAGSIEGAQPAAGWTFSATTTEAEVVIEPPSGVTEEETGATNFDLTFPEGVLEAPITVIETQQPGYTLVPQNGSNASCVRLDTLESVPVTNVGSGGFTVVADALVPISCTVYNRAPTPGTTLTVEKEWVVDGNTYANGAQPPGLTASLKLDGQDAQFGQTFPGLQAPDVVEVDEEVEIDLDLCTLDERLVTEVNGQPADESLPYPLTLTEDPNTVTVRNTVTCESRLILEKSVPMGDADPQSWQLSATGPLGSIVGPSGVSGVSALVTPGVVYALAESGGNPNYIQDDRRTDPVPGSTGSWECAQEDGAGTVIPGFDDGLDGGVTVPLGSIIRCTATNLTSQIHLVKTVSNTWGGTAVPGDWDLTATPTGAPPDGVLPQTVTGSETGTSIYVLPGQEFELSEASDVTGYSLESLECSVEGEPSAELTLLTLEAGQQAICTFANVDEPALLTLSKIVDPGVGAVTDVAEDWTLTAEPDGIPGQVTVSGNGNPATAGGVSQVPVMAGTYTLSESGPPGYSASDWTCTGGVLEDDQITVTNGETVECEITNTTITARLTLAKVVDNADGAGRADATEWNLRAGGPTVILGSTGSPEVTDAVVEVGTYLLTEQDGPGGYTASVWSCTGAATSDADSVTLEPGESATCTITNTAIAPRLTLIKRVINDEGGTAEPEEWTLTAAGPTNISGATGSATVTDAVVDAGNYLLSESDGPPGYSPSQFGWNCTGATSSTEFSVELEAGDDATCTLINNDSGSTLTLVKTVTNDNGGSASPEDWTLGATGPSTISGPTGNIAVTNAPVDAGTYALSEAGPTGYIGTWSCTGGVTLNGNSLELPNGVSATCTVNNDDVQPTLTLVKAVNNQNGAGTATATEWNLTATDGTTTISGATGSDPVTGAPVDAGVYTLSENGPTGYTSSDWSCVGATDFTATSVDLGPGENATCTITNTAIRPTLTLVKEVVNQAGGTAVPTDWTLAAAGPTPGVSGPTGSPAVTAAPVNAGTYALFEEGPAGYTAGGWVCTGATATTGTSVEVQAGQNATCTITNTDQPAILTLAKSVTNDNGGSAEATDFTLTATPDAATADLGQEPVSGNGDPSDPGGVNAVPVFAGTYTLSEIELAGYTAGAWNCTAGTLEGAELVLAPGVSATCTIVNDDQPAELTLVKTVTNDDGGTAAETDWNLTATDGTTTISGPTGSDPVTAAPVNAGTYTLGETGGPSGYTAGAWSCDAGTLTGDSLVLTPGVNATCTIDNDDQPATLTLVKTVDNGLGAGSAVPGDWTLSATDGTTTISGATGTTAVTEAPVPAGVFALSEDGPAGYTPSGWSCTGGTLNAADLTLGNGEAATCTINNTAVAPLLTLVKVVDNDSGAGTAVSRDWTLTASGPVTITGLTADATITAAPVQVGTYDLSESGPSGYTASSWDCTGAATTTEASVTVVAGSNAICRITNTAIAPRLTLEKTVTNDNGGTAEPDEWTLTASGPTVISGETGSGTVTDAVVQAGTYTLAETGGPSGYQAGSWNCVGATVIGTQITLGPGDDATCTIDNDDQPARITLAKVVVPGSSGSARVPADWTLTATGPTAGISGPSGDPLVTGVTVDAGDYDLSETGPTGFTAGDWTCGTATIDGDTVTVPNGGDVTCSITNTAIAPRLTLVKVVDNSDGAGAATESEWTLNAASPTTSISGATGNAAVTDAEVTVGTYALSEIGPAGYTPSDWVCTGGGATTADSVTLAEGQDATCTITNTAIPATLTLIKNVVNEAGGTAEPADWTLTADGPTTISGAGGVPATVVDAGSYDLSESTGPGGYTASPWSCTGATSSTGTEVEIDAGQTVVCTITNLDQPATLTLVKTVDNGDTGATHTATEWTLTAAGPLATITGATGQTAVTDASVPAGIYALSESGPSGYTTPGWSCTGGSVTDGAVTVPNGGNVTCTIANTAVVPRLTLTKVVDNGAGFGAAGPTEWTLTAVNDSSTITGVSGDTDVTNAAAVAGTYDLSESGGPSGYTAGSWSCTGGTGSTATSVTLDAGSAATCTITNTAVAPRLTLVKTVVNDNGGNARPADWILAADGPTDISGPTESAAVTDQPVAAGTYELSETDGPSGYRADPWRCTGGELTGSSLELGPGDVATCTLDNNDIAPLLTLVKTVTNDNGGTAEPDEWNLAAIGPTTISGPTGSDAITSRPVNAGTYGLGEMGGPAGYTAGGWSCTGGGTLTGGTLLLVVGEVATCTIDNDDQPAQLTLVKTVTNDSGGTALPTEWNLAATDGTTTITGPSGDPLVTAVTVNAGTWTLSETDGPAGYTAGDWSCSAGTLTGDSLVLTPGVNATCTINNDDQPATLTLVKTVTNFNGGTAVPTDWTLSAAGPTPISGQTGSAAVTSATVNAGTYILSESGGPAGYTPSSWSCTAGTLSGDSLVLSPGVNATCTIDNDDQQATLTLVKTVTNFNGGVALPIDWTLTATGPTTISGASGLPGVTAVAVNAGTYTLSESGPAGYTAGTWSCTAGTLTGDSLVLSPGVNATCTINNDDQQATLTLVKTVTNDDGGTALPSAWTLTATGPTTIAGSSGLAGVTAVAVNAGTYTLAESGPAGYTAGDWSCTVGASPPVAGDTVFLGSGEVATCTIHNDDLPAQLTLHKVVDNGTTGVTSTPLDWTLTATPMSIPGQDPVTGNGDATDPGGVNAVPVFAGSYALSESALDGYSPSSWSCVGGSLIGSRLTIANGESADCTITNTAIQPLLTLVKMVQNPDGSGTAVPTDWTLTANGPITISGVVGSVAVTNAAVPIGTYALSEAGPGGYTAEDWSCVGGSMSGSDITLALGDGVTCTITNTAIPPTLTLTKTVTNDHGGTAEATDWTLTADSGSASISGVTGSGPVTGVAVPVGTYALSESVIAGYAAGAWICTGTGTQNGAQVTLGSGQTATCTINNDDEPAQLTLRKVVDNGASGATSTPLDWTLSATPVGITGQPTVSGNGDPTDSGGVNAVGVSAGSYDLSESVIDGYTPSDWVCEGGTLSDSRLTVANGDSADCTITNTAIQTQLTLIKEVNNGDGGIAVPTDWTLTATPEAIDGQDPLSGAGGVPTTGVLPGTYNLSEDGGPAGYTAGAWACTGGVLDGSALTLALGDDATCTITSDDLPATWQLNKTSDPPSGTVVTLGDTITYTITATNTGPTAPRNLTVTDDLADVLDDAEFMDGSITASTGSATQNGTRLTWLIDRLQTTATITYKVTITAKTAGASVINAVTSQADLEEPTDLPPTNCATPAQTAPPSSPVVAESAVAGTGVLAAAVNEGCATNHTIGSPTIANTTTTTVPGVPATPQPPAATPESGTPFAFTGAQSIGLFGLGMVLVGLGLGLLVIRRRRTT